MERLQTIAFPPEGYRPRDSIKRRVIVDFESRDEWRDWFRNLQATDIEWRPSQWNLGDMTWAVERKNEVLLVGMDVVVAYYPSYIRRQYGLSATFPNTFTPQPLPAMTRSFLGAYQDKWARRLKRGPEPSFTVHLPDGYDEYMRTEFGKVRERIHEKEEERKRQRKY